MLQWSNEMYNVRRSTFGTLNFFYIQIKFYKIIYILLYFLIITVRHYGGDTKRSKITRPPHGYMEKTRIIQEKFTQKKQRGRENKDEQHTSKYDVKLRVEVGYNQVFAY